MARSRVANVSAAVLYLVSLTYANVFEPLGGPYYATVFSVKDLDDIPRNKIDWKTYVSKENMCDVGFHSTMVIKEKLCPVKVNVTASKWSGGEWKKSLLDGAQNFRDVICKYDHVSLMLKSYNVTFYDKDCCFHPARACIKPFNMDDIMQKSFTRLMYGRFKVGVRFLSCGVEVMGFEIILEFRKREEELKAIKQCKEKELERQKKHRHN